METPTINVNLGQCVPTCWDVPGEHLPTCPGKPVLVPLPLEPWRTVTIKVRLGECDYPRDACRFGHLDGCRASPIEVTCSITGKTWAGSDVASAHHSPGPGRMELELSPSLPVFAACRDRWALMKALVIPGSGVAPLHDGMGVEVMRLVAQRDAVFTALADMARAEQSACDAQDRAHVALGDDLRLKPHHNIDAVDRPSAYMLERYVERLIEQVGSLT